MKELCIETYNSSLGSIEDNLNKFMAWKTQFYQDVSSLKQIYSLKVIQNKTQWVFFSRNNQVLSKIYMEIPIYVE